MQRYQTEDEHRKAMRAKINKTIKRGRRRKRIIRRLKKAVPGICIGVFIAGMGAWCIAAPLPDPDDYEPYRFQAENGQWYTQEEYKQYKQMSRERDAYHQREREEAEKEAQMIRDYQEQYQKDQEAEWKLYQEQTRTGLIHSMDFDASDAYLLEKKAMELITVEHWDESQGALYFEKASDESTWHSRNLQKLFTHGAHTFYTEKE